jgi:hypothetical protein
VAVEAVYRVEVVVLVATSLEQRIRSLVVRHTVLLLVLLVQPIQTVVIQHSRRLHQLVVVAVVGLLERLRVALVALVVALPL